MNFARLWLSGYHNPRRFTEALSSKPAPQWGLYAQILRSLMDSLLIYLPAVLMGLVPQTPSWLTFIPTQGYYTTLIWLTPLVFLTQWLLGAAVISLLLRLLKVPADFDQLLNLTGMASLVVGTVLVVWDWLCFFTGLADQYFLGISHLLIDIWWFVLVVTGLKRIAGVRLWLGIVLSLMAFAAAMPLAVIVMRAPF